MAQLTHCSSVMPCGVIYLCHHWFNEQSCTPLASSHSINKEEKLTEIYKICHQRNFFLGRSSAKCRILCPGARPTNGISIEFEMRSKFAMLWFKMCSNDRNQSMHMSRQCHCWDVYKISWWLAEYIMHKIITIFLLNLELDKNMFNIVSSSWCVLRHIICNAHIGIYFPTLWTQYLD